jgi:glycosyltransferase involved in cell wall biosynthesis
MDKLSFVIPCYNSESSLGIVVDEILLTMQNLRTYDYEIILVNDDSIDNTMGIIKKICKQNTKVIGLNLSKNFRQPSAMLAGYSVASGDYVIHSDDDGQTPIDQLPELLNKLNEGFDMVCAKYDIKQNSFVQNLGTRINNLMAYYLIEKPKDLHFSNFWICKRFIIEEIIKSENPYPYLTGMILGVTRNIGTAAAIQRKRLTGKTNYTFSKMVSLWLNGFTAFSIKPLRIASLLGLIISLLSFAFMLSIILNKINHPNIPLGYSSIMCAIAFIGGLVMIMLGLIGEYIGRIYININKKPQFVIKEYLNYNNLQ